MPWGPAPTRNKFAAPNRNGRTAYEQELDRYQQQEIAARGGQFTPSYTAQFAGKTWLPAQYDINLANARNLQSYPNSDANDTAYLQKLKQMQMSNTQEAGATDMLGMGTTGLSSVLPGSSRPGQLTWTPSGVGLPGEEPKSGWGNLFGGAWDWMKSKPLDAAKIGLGILNYGQRDRQLDQWDDYQDDVRAQMAFDQKDVDRRWDLTMKDWESRQARDAAFDHSQRLATV